MTPNLLDELEKIVALSEKATPGEWARDWNNDVGPNDDYYVEWEEVGPVQIHGQNASADAEYLHALHNCFRTHAPALADMAKRLEAAERDAAKLAPCLWVQDADDGSWDTACGNKHMFIDGDAADNLYQHCPYCGGHLIEPNYDAIDATQEGEG